MRHNKKFNHLSRKAAHRQALLSNLTISLIKHKRINTTLAKAKALRVYCEPIITRSKKDDMANRRLVFSYLQDKEAVKELFGVIADKVANRPGGYCRILKTGYRMGDGAEMAMIELVDFNENMLKEASVPVVVAATRKLRLPQLKLPPQKHLQQKSPLRNPQNKTAKILDKACHKGTKAPLWHTFFCVNLQRTSRPDRLARA